MNAAIAPPTATGPQPGVLAWHTVGLVDVFELQRAGVRTGLTSVEVAVRRDEYGS